MAGNSFPPRTLPELKAVSAAGLARALGAGRAHAAAVLVPALSALWRPREARAAKPDGAPLTALGFATLGGADAAETVATVSRIEAARYVARDITGTDPEQMTPGRAAAYCEELFEGSPVAVSVLEDPKEIRRAYPLIGAVSRASCAGVRVRIGNTDAEGRLVLADLLAALREEAEGAPDPALFSVATLTGHVYRAFGPYTSLLANGAARRARLAERIQAAGEEWGEPCERPAIRREDYAFIEPRSDAEDVVSCNSEPSTMTARGHQFPFAFLDLASGIRGTKLPFVHLDIGGSAVANGDWQFG